MFARIGSWCHNRRKTVVVVWVAALFVLGGASGAVGTDFRDDFNLPDVESRTGFDILDEDFGGQGAGLTGTIVFRAEQGVDDPEVRAGMEALFAELDARDDLTVVSPYSEAGGSQIAQEGPEAGKIAYADIEMPEETAFTEALEVADRAREGAPDIEGLQVEVGGGAFGEFETPDSEVLGLAFAIVILILAFGSVLAMGLPVAVALAGISVGTVLLLLSTNIMAVPDFAQFLGLMIGLGVGIDYALFIVTRYREDLHHGHTVAESTAIAIDTAGRAVPLRRHHRGHLAARHAGDRRGLRVRPGHRRRPRGVHHGRRVAHAAAGAARLRRREGRGHPLAGPHRRRPRGPGPPRSGPEDPGAGSRGLRAGRRDPGARPRARAPQAGGPPSSAEAPPADAGVPLEPAHPAPALARLRRRHGRPAAPGDTRLRAAPRLLRRGQLRGGHHHAQGLRPAGRRASAPASTVRCCSSAETPGGAGPGQLAGHHHRDRRRPWRGLRVPADPERRRGAHRGPLAHHPHQRPPGCRHHGPRQPPAQRGAPAR